ncbi:hypothetical protein Leryth_022132, partial [Lithospermum erythrorhizon]
SFNQNTILAGAYSFIQEWKQALVLEKNLLTNQHTLPDHHPTRKDVFFKELFIQRKNCINPNCLTNA